MDLEYLKMLSDGELQLLYYIAQENQSSTIKELKKEMSRRVREA